MSLVFDTVGWVGAVLVLIAYILISTSRIQSTALSYQLMNIFGALMLLGNNVFYGALPGGFVNFVWAGVALVVITRKPKQAG